MATCLYLTVLDRPCGRPTNQRLAWSETRPRTGVTLEFDQPLCPFHFDLTLAELVLDCTVETIITNPGVAA